ncbi:GntP family gluconate:H+ symporter [Methanohalophilus levihalophilus]|uniref:GntP family permease n=1 Tax=Methanohalophilus levihalophilus TaxID=1431282 RepID=UPI001AE6EFC7|nr:GntP family permease [Methanohalophilus levihalophilus]MBP2029768.1 GntP family gluconate:H+ symporter [Methanohalophilus levihalophilus]
MESILIFALTLIGITAILWRFRLPPFFALTGAALFYGFLSGMQEMTIVFTTQGAGKIFALLAIPIFCGSLIAQVVRQEKYGSRIVTDIEKLSGKPALSSGIVGYLLSIPLMCCMTAYVVMVPLVENLKVDEHVRKKCFYAAAIGSTLSFVLLFPLPVLYSITTNLGIENVAAFNGITLPASIVLFIIGYLVLWKKDVLADVWKGSDELAKNISRIAWIPILLPILLLAIGYAYQGFSLLTNINLAMFLAALFSLFLLKEKNRSVVFEKGTKNAGIILLDLCGAGALGGVIAASSLADDTYLLLEGAFPIIVIPFILAALVQTAQGSRVVTAIVASSIIAQSSYAAELTASSLILMISAGTLIVSYVTDPYFWLIQRTTKDSIREVICNYTLPLATLGLLLFAATLVLDAFLF